MIAQGTGYVQGGHPRAQAKLRAHIRYLEHRSGGERSTIFSAERSNVSRAAALADLASHGDRVVAYHKIVLSPSAEERLGIEHWQQWTREVLHDFGAQRGLELTWYAVHHTNTDDPHVHVVLAGSGTRADGAAATVKLSVRDFRMLERSGRERSEVELIRQARDVIADADRLEARELGLLAPAQEPSHASLPLVGLQVGANLVRELDER